jgi:hypothetical protein
LGGERGGYQLSSSRWATLTNLSVVERVSTISVASLALSTVATIPNPSSPPLHLSASHQMAATSTFVPALPTINALVNDSVPLSDSAHQIGQSTASHSRRGGAIRGGGNRSRGRGNGRIQNGGGSMDSQEQGTVTPFQPGDGAYLAGGPHQPMNGNQGRRPNQPRIPQGPHHPRQRVRNTQPQRAPQNQLPLPADHSRSGIAGIAHGAVAGSITEGQTHGDSERVPSSRGAPRNRNRNNRNRKPPTGQDNVEGSSHPQLTSNGDNVGSGSQPRKNGRDRQQAQLQQGAPRSAVNARRAAFGGKLQSYAPNGRGRRKSTRRGARPSDVGLFVGGQTERVWDDQGGGRFDESAYSWIDIETLLGMSDLFLRLVAITGDLVVFTDLFIGQSFYSRYDLLLHAIPFVVYARLVVTISQRSPGACT